MSCTLVIPYDSTMDAKLEEQWVIDDKDVEWSDYVLSLGNGIIDAETGLLGGGTLVTFETEAHRNWFILRWS